MLYHHSIGSLRIHHGCWHRRQAALGHGVLVVSSLVDNCLCTFLSRDVRAWSGRRLRGSNPQQPPQGHDSFIIVVLIQPMPSVTARVGGCSGLIASASTMAIVPDNLLLFSSPWRKGKCVAFFRASMTVHIEAQAIVAQWQSTIFPRLGLWVRLPSIAPLHRGW